jgi:hypothetical protein
MSANPSLTLVAPFKPSNRREKLWEKHGRKCHWCGCDTQISWNNAATDSTIDHILPRSDGGTDDLSNVVSACNLCNNRRDYEWKKRLGEGSLLGQWPLRTPQQKAMKVPRIKQTEDILREQRDQAQKEIATLRKEMKQWEATVAAQEQELKTFKSMTVWVFIRKKLADWIKP